MRVEEIRRVLESIGKRPSKRFGQHFLLDDSVIRHAVALADLTSEDTVLEIGPGLGNLTEELLRAGSAVVVVEQDPAFAEFLKRRFDGRIELVRADAVKAFLPQFNKVVSNLPYQISSPITFKLLDLGFEVAVLMLQREFAERMIAEPGSPDYGRLTVGVFYKADCRIMLKVPRTSFWPQPRVDSCIVRLVPRPPPFKVADEKVFYDVTKAVFSHRRKKIANSLLVNPSVSHLMTKKVRESVGRLPYSSQRGEELTPAMIGELADALLALSLSS